MRPTPILILTAALGLAPAMPALAQEAAVAAPAAAEALPAITVSDVVPQPLAERIIAGTIEPGSRLRQDHIAEEFETSHVPVREAFRRLEAQGLAISEP